MSYRILTILMTTAVCLTACDGSNVKDRTDPCPPGSEACACGVDPICEHGLVCDAEARICRRPVTCDAVECAPNRICMAPDAGDAVCAKECEPGWEWSDLSGTCSPMPPTCAVDESTSVLETCRAQSRTCIEVSGRGRCGGCMEDHIINTEDPDGPCVPKPTCTDELIQECAGEGRECVDGACSASCRDGYVEEEGACIATNCGGKGVPGGLGDYCASLRRGCEVTDEGAVCTSCVENHLSENQGEGCRPVETCASLECQNLSRLCEAGAEGEDAVCSTCRAGYEEIAGKCSPLEGATCSGGGIADACEAEGRTCDPDGPLGARCGACTKGLVPHPWTDECVEPLDCDEIGCEAQERQCESEPTAVCTDCLEGRIEDVTGDCRAPLTCKDLDCDEMDLECIEPPKGVMADARCVTTLCADNELWNGFECTPCPPCDRPGERGKDLRPTVAGWCICQTEKNYFYSVANEVGAVPCDADQDGFVRESARPIFESGDPVLIDNARCDLKRIDRVVLHTEGGAEKTVTLNTPLPLYESVRNDDNGVLREAWSRAALPTDKWGENRDGVNASLLNSFTKLCHNPRADYNDNGYPDVNEYYSAPPAPGYRPDQQPFITYSYFLELHRGWFQAPDDGEAGAWHIAERSRKPDVDDGTPVRYPGKETWWQSCERLPDPNRDLTPPVGLDFANHPPKGSWPGMNHHSQFKCVVVKDVPDDAVPSEMTPAEASEAFVLNDCTTKQAPTAAQSVNPSEPDLSCTLLDSTPASGTALWGAVPYTPYEDASNHEGYKGGCLNTCAEAKARHAADPTDRMCPGIPENALECESLDDDYGRLSCYDVSCDEIDNDGDGETDEAPLSPCPTGLLGECAQGTGRCVGHEFECVAPDPSAEDCDNLDNDCDGEIDEQLDGIHCSRPSTSLQLDSLQGVCGDRSSLCVDGVWDCIPDLDTYEPDGETLCDGLDNDCDGMTDELLMGHPVEGQPDGAVFGGLCQATGQVPEMGICLDKTWKCEAGTPVCTPRIPPTEDEGCPEGAPADCIGVCDGLDNDCDGNADENNACRRYLKGTLAVYPRLTDSDNNMGGSAVKVNAEVSFAGVNDDAITVTMKVGADEMAWNWTKAYGVGIDERKISGTVATIERNIMPFSATYEDGDDAKDILKVNGTSIFETQNIKWIDDTPRTDHDAVVKLECNGRVDGNDDVRSTLLVHGNTMSHKGLLNTDVGCRVEYEVAYTVIPTENDCSGFTSEEACDGIDNDCDGEVDEPDYPVPDALRITFGDQTVLSQGDQLYAVMTDDTELALLDADFFNESPYPDITIVGNSLKLRFESPTNTSRVNIRAITDNNDIDRSVPRDMVDILPGTVTKRTSYWDSFGLGQICGSDVGECVSGVLTCEVGTVVCQGSVAPVPESNVCDGKEEACEVCNNLDDDCNGVADDWVRLPCETPCGPGTISCLPDAVCMGACEDPAQPNRCGQPGLRYCSNPGAGVYDGTCTWDEVFPPEVCDGVDNDCDGQTDNGLDHIVGDPCSAGKGNCRVDGAWGCTPDGGMACSAVADENQASDEICNGADDNCDGEIDNPPSILGACATQQQCETDNGWICADNQWRCSDGVPDEQCGNSVDDDCDGSTDEGCNTNTQS